MNLKKVILSDISTEAKVSAIALLLDKELPKLTDQVDTVKKLKGEQGDRGLQGDKGNAGRDGKDGKDGRDGKDGSIGKNGKDGEDGVSVVNAKVDFDDSLVFTLSDGKTINVGEVKGEKGENGRDGNTGANGIGVPTGGTSGQILAKNSSLDYDTGWITNSGSGTVTSVAATAGTGISITGSPITTSGTLNITNSAPDQTVVLTAGTGISTSGTYPNFTVTNSAPDQTVALTGAGTTSITGTYPNFTITSNDSATGTVTSVAATAGTGISITGSPITTSGTLNITNTAPDQIVALTQGGTTTITGTYPNFTISSADQFQGTVTSVTGTSPVVSSGGATPAISMAAATTSVSGYLTSTDWNTFNGKGSGTVTSVAALTLGTAGTDLGSTVANGTTTPVITLNVPTASATNRGALSSADWTTFNNKGSGTVTSVAATVPSFLSVAGSPITTSGTLAITLSGTALPIANGGTGATSLAGASIATYTGTETLTNKRIDPRVTSAASASTLTPNISASDVYAYTALAAGLTINAPTGTPLDGDKLIFRLLDNGTSRALTWDATYTVIGVTLPTATTVSKTTYVGCIYNANNTRWDVIAVTTQA